MRCEKKNQLPKGKKIPPSSTTYIRKQTEFFKYTCVVIRERCTERVENWGSETFWL